MWPLDTFLPRGLVSPPHSSLLLRLISCNTQVLYLRCRLKEGEPGAQFVRERYVSIRLGLVFRCWELEFQSNVDTAFAHKLAGPLAPSLSGAQTLALYDLLIYCQWRI